MRVRPLLVPLVALLALAACADDTTSPTAADGSAALAPKLPSFGLVSAGTYGEIFDFPEAKWTDPYGVGSAYCGPTSGTPWACVAPKPWKPTDFDVAIHMRDRSAWDAPAPFRGMHGTGCQPYQSADVPDPTSNPNPNVVRIGDVGSHDVATTENMNYRCRNHMMTSLKAAGYGVIYVTPNAVLDLDATTTIRFALSTLRLSGNDWIDIWVTPWAENLKLPLDAALSASGVDVQGPPRNAVHIRMTGDSGATRFTASVVSEFQESALPQAPSAVAYDAILIPNSTFRDTFELTVSRTSLKFGLVARTGGVPHPALTWVNTAVNLPASFTSSVVQFGHHSMSQTLASNAGVGGTWHWDDFAIAPAAPFTIIRANNVEGASLPNDRYADSKHPDMQLASAMPATGARFVRFAAYGDKVRVSFGNGKWIDAVPQPEGQSVDGRFHSYFVPVPADVGSATTVSFKAKKDKLAAEPTNEDEGVWRVRDVAVWVR